MGLVTEYPAWFFLFCLLLGGGYAFGLYYRSRTDEVAPVIKGFLFLFRFLSVTLIAFLLLSPLVKRTVENVVKPLIILGVDNSESVSLSADSSYYRKTLPGEIISMKEELGKKYDVRLYTFGDHVAADGVIGFREKETDMASFLQEMDNRLINQNVGALILFSDGIINAGQDPFYAAGRLNFPVFTVALGDTITKKDVILKNVLYNHTAFLGDKAPLQADLLAWKCDGDRSVLTVMKGEETIFRKDITFHGNQSAQKIDLQLEMKEKGLQHYRVTVAPVDGEQNNSNNSRDIFIDIQEARQKIALIYNAPHPDVAAMKAAVINSNQFEIETFRWDEFDKPVKQYDLVIFYQPSAATDVQKLARSFGDATSALFILGTQTDFNLFNSLKTGLAINPGKSGFSEAYPILSDAFALFTIEPEKSRVMKDWPPLMSPFGSYQYTSLGDVLFYQKISTVTTKIPLIFFMQMENKKIGIIAGENIWRWRISDYEQNTTHDAFDELIRKIIQYLSVREDKSFFRIRVAARIQENDPVEMEAQVFNDSYEIINTPDVKISITDAEKKNYPYVFTRSDKSYYLNAGYFQPGNYKYSASVTVGKKQYGKTGEFFVVPVDIESADLVADHALLKRIASSHSGEMYYPKQLNELTKKILGREDIHALSYFQKRYTDLVGTLWLFLLILALLSAEWIIRKRGGLS